MDPVPPPSSEPNPPPDGKRAHWSHEAGQRLLATLPFLKSFMRQATVFAAESSWWRIVLLGIVVFVAISIIGDIIGVDRPVVVTSGLDKPVDIRIHTDHNNITVEPTINGKPGKPIEIPLPPGAMNSPSAPSGPMANADTKGAHNVEIDKDALRFEHNGKRFVIDSHGVRVIPAGEGEDSSKSDGANEPPEPPPIPAHPESGAASDKAAHLAKEAAAQADNASRKASSAMGKADTEMREADREEISEQVKAAIEDSRDDINDAIAEAVAANEKVSVRRRENLAFWDVFKILVIISFAYLVAIKVSSTKTQRADAMVKSASMTAERESLQRQLVEARMQMMQAQVEPHFLFNTLASVEYLIGTDPQRASVMQKNLIQYLRAALPQMRESSTNLGREVDLVRAYLEILKVRMEERLVVSFTVPEGLRSADFPPMMLQSLVENAIKHGLEPKAEGGALAVAAEIVDGELFVSVADTGLGFSPDGAGTSGGGVGITNIRERLALLYGARGRFVVEPNEPSGTRVTIIIPYTPMGKRNRPTPEGEST